MNKPLTVKDLDDGCIQKCIDAYKINSNDSEVKIIQNGEMLRKHMLQAFGLPDEFVRTKDRE
jgi:hypothetical protein